jgi:hypothetical protein
MWVDDVYSLVAAGKIDDAMDVVFQEFDELFIAGKFDEANEMLGTIDLLRLDIQLISGVMASTCVAKDKLPGRKLFVEKARKRFTELVPDRVEGLMRGME